MEEWKEYRLGDVVEMQKGFAFKSTDYSSQGIKIIKVSNLNKKLFDDDNCVFISPILIEYYSRYILKEDDIIISTVGSWPTNPESVVGKICLIPKEINNSLLNQNAVRLRAKDGFYQKFLYYLLSDSSFSFYIAGTAQGSANQASITLGDIRSFTFYSPDTKGQKVIASILSSLDDKIELNRKINANLEAQAQALFKSWFVDFEPFKDQPFVESELGMIPKGWRVEKLGEVCKCVLGGTPSRNNPEYWDGDIAWINSGEVNKFRITEASEYITEEGLKHSATKLLPRKTTVLAITGATLGQVSLLEIDTCANQSVIGILENDNLPYAFIYPLIRDRIEELMSHMTGGAQQHINKNNVEGLDVIIPPKSVMVSFKGIALAIYEKIGYLSLENSRLASLRDALLPRLMSGELKVFDKPNDKS